MPKFARNHPPGRFGGIGGPDEVQLQRSPSIGHHAHGGDYGMNLVVLQDLGENPHVFVVCRNKLNTEFFFLCGIRLLRVSSAVEC
jgi:hypothetical protein